MKTHGRGGARYDENGILKTGAKKKYVGKNEKKYSIYLSDEHLEALENIEGKSISVKIRYIIEHLL